MPTNPNGCRTSGWNINGTQWRSPLKRSAILPAGTLVVIVPATNLTPDRPIKCLAHPVQSHSWPAETEGLSFRFFRCFCHDFKIPFAGANAISMFILP